MLGTTGFSWKLEMQMLLPSAFPSSRVQSSLIQYSSYYASATEVLLLELELETGNWKPETGTASSWGQPFQSIPPIHPAKDLLQQQQQHSHGGSDAMRWRHRSSRSPGSQESRPGCLTLFTSPLTVAAVAKGNGRITSPSPLPHLNLFKLSAAQAHPKCNPCHALPCHAMPRPSPWLV